MDVLTEVLELVDENLNARYIPSLPHSLQEKTATMQLFNGNIAFDLIS